MKQNAITKVTKNVKMIRLITTSAVSVLNSTLTAFSWFLTPQLFQMALKISESCFQRFCYTSAGIQAFSQGIRNIRLLHIWDPGPLSILFVGLHHRCLQILFSQTHQYPVVRIYAGVNSFAYSLSDPRTQLTLSHRLWHKYLPPLELNEDSNTIPKFCQLGLDKY